MKSHQAGNTVRIPIEEHLIHPTNIQVAWYNEDLYIYEKKAGKKPEEEFIKRKDALMLKEGKDVKLTEW